MNALYKNFQLYKSQVLFFFIILIGGCSSISPKLSDRSASSEYSQEAENKWIAENVKGLENITHDQLASWQFVVHVFWPFLKSFDQQDAHMRPYLSQNHYPIFVQSGLIIRIIKDNETMTDISELSHLKGKKLSDVYGEAYANDKRTVDELGGEASHRLLIIKANRIPPSPHGMYNTLYHEFSHLVHQTGFSQAQLDKLEQLYSKAKKKNIFYDDYAASNSAEYFACSVETFLSETKLDKSWHGYAEEKSDLVKRDPEMASFITELLSQK